MICEMPSQVLARGVLRSSQDHWVRVRVSENLFCCWVCFWFFCYVLFCLLDFTTTERDIGFGLGLGLGLGLVKVVVGFVFGFFGFVLFCFVLFCFVLLDFTTNEERNIV